MTNDREDGFTLVEILVVVVILGVLAAIAIPRFLDQRQTASNSAAITDLRNLIPIQLGLEASGSAYSSDSGLLDGEGWASSPSVVVCVDVISATDVAITAWHELGNTVYTWQRSISGIDANEVPVQPTDCSGSGTPVS